MAVISVVVVVAGVILTVVLISNHRADLEAEERRESASAKASSESAASVASVEARESEEAAALAAAQEAYDSCMRMVGPFRNALSDIDARLDVGLSLTEMSDFLGDASVAYNKIDIDGLGDGNCLSAAAKMESAFNAYNTTVTRWDKCIFDSYYCELDDIEPAMQLKWLRASQLLDRADKLLDEMDPASPTYVEGAAGNLVV